MLIGANVRILFENCKSDQSVILTTVGSSIGHNIL